MENEGYGLIVVGGGPGGYNAAERAAHAGIKTLLIEERELGGVCLNEGCIPTKTLLYSAKVYDYAKHASDYGVSVSGASLDHGAVITRKNKVVAANVAGIKSTLRRAGVTVFNASATITGKSAEGFTVAAGDRSFTGKKLLICTGSEAVVPPITGLQESVASGFAMTSREILDLRELPKSLVVIGGGVIGLELASYFNSAGTKVTVVEMLPSIAGATDAELAGILKKSYEKRGVTFMTGTKVTSVSNGVVEYEANGKPGRLECDRALVCVGRRPRTAGIGLESVGVLTERGAVLTDERLRTSVPGIWAAGDVNGKLMLAHTAYREGEVAVNDMLGIPDRMNYRAVPSVIYTNPEVAAVGETETSAEAAGIPVTVASLPLKYSGRYVAENETETTGIVKLVVGKRHKNLLGVHIIGPYASEMIYGAAMAVERELRVDDLKKVVFPHPTVGEVIRETLFTVK